MNASKIEEGKIYEVKVGKNVYVELDAMRNCH